MRSFIMEIGTARCCLDKLSCFPLNLTTSDFENFHKLPRHISVWNPRTNYQNSVHSNRASTCKYRIRMKTYSMAFSVEESPPLNSENFYSDGENEDDSEESREKILSQPLSREELRSLLTDSERQKLVKKLSEANQQNRYLKRQLYVTEDALVNFKSELAVLELEIQALVSLAEEIAQSSIPEGSRRINGKFIQSHLLSRLEAVHEKVKEQIKDVDTAQSKEVPLFWCGMAESVQVMGTFDGWSQGGYLSPEYDGSFTRFSTTLMLRPGRYEIKFLVDGEWHLSPEFPTVGEGLMKNNLLIVE
ncbi:protein PTST, chloroplastic [Pistacia vera]|uniref:protein PTST, chloroplastic n=1 Tax=Pistacia vera TaxID=55513 RepID=UPI0012637235|nr:protein PTST, chloroplastic [Pistacia vera]